MKVCVNGHKFYKSSDCPVCPVCEAENKPDTGFLSDLSAPARRALLNNGIDTIKKLASFTESDLLRFHGFGRASLPKLRQALKKEGLSFRK